MSKRRAVWALTTTAVVATIGIAALLAYSTRDDSESLPTGTAAGTVTPDRTFPTQGVVRQDVPRAPVMDKDAIDRAQKLGRLPLSSVKKRANGLRANLKDKNQPAALRNIVANRLGDVEDKELPGALRHMLFDEEEWPKWRAYCVQQLHECYLREQESDACLDAIFKATEIDMPVIRKAAIWNLALIATSRQKEKRPSAEKIARIRQEVMRVFGEKDAAEEVTLAAVQAAGQMGIAEALPAVRAVVADEKTSKPFRLRAVTVLGKLGGQSDLELLKKIGSNGSARFKKVVATAIDRIKARGEVERPEPPEPAVEPRPEETKF